MASAPAATHRAPGCAVEDPGIDQGIADDDIGGLQEARACG
jgi:hypothetical protein